MDQIMELLGKFFGGGVISTVAGGVLGLMSKAKDIELEKIRNVQALEIAKLASADARAAAIEADKQADLSALQAAVAADRATYGDSPLGKVVDFARGMVRPVITYCAFAVIVWAAADAFKSDDADRIAAIVNICGIPVGYWFGSRMPGR